MEAVAHSPAFARKAGVPQSVGQDFARADDRAGITRTHGGKPAPSAHKRPFYGNQHRHHRDF